MLKQAADTEKIRFECYSETIVALFQRPELSFDIVYTKASQRVWMLKSGMIGIFVASDFFDLSVIRKL